mgnify:FL=1
MENTHNGPLNNKILKPKDVANILGCSLNRAYRIIRQKDFPYKKIGKRYFISHDELEKWINSYYSQSPVKKQ